MLNLQNQEDKKDKVYEYILMCISVIYSHKEQRKNGKKIRKRRDVVEEDINCNY